MLGMPLQGESKQAKFQLDGDIIPASSKEYQWRHTFHVAQTKSEAHIHIRAEIFGEGFDDGLVEVLHIREHA